MPPKSFLTHRPSIRSRGYLPHWDVPDATYSITFRLADSLPKHIIEQLAREQRALAQINFDLRLDEALDACRGSCALKEPPIAELVVAALRYFDRSRYDLLTWCVMPNHVHVLARLFDALDSIVHSWKSYTSNHANVILGRSGRFWAREYFDRVVRDEEDLGNVHRYIMNNPEKAGLRHWPWRGTVF